MSPDKGQQHETLKPGTVTETQDDKKSPEVVEEGKISSVRLLSFLKANSISIETYKTSLTLEKVIEFSKSGNKYEKEVYEKLSSAQEILSKINKTDLMTIDDEGLFESELDLLKKKPYELNESQLSKLRSAWQEMTKIREMAFKLLSLSASTTAHIRGDNFNTIDSWVDKSKGMMGNVGKEWNRMSSGEKMLFAGLSIISAIWFMGSENTQVQKMKSGLKTGAMMLGGGFVINKLFQLFTGKSLLDTTIEGSKRDTNSSLFLKEAFRTDDKNAELIAKSFNMLGGVKMMDLIEKFKSASSTHKIEGTAMDGTEAYQVLQVIFAKYPIESIIAKFKDSKPDIGFNDAMIVLMSEDKSLKMNENLYSSLTEYASAKLRQTFNFARGNPVTEKLLSYKEKYFDKQLTEIQLAENFTHVVETEQKVEEVIRKKLAADKKDIADGLAAANSSGELDPSSGVKAKIDAKSGYTYMVYEAATAGKLDDTKEITGTLIETVNAFKKYIETLNKASGNDKGLQLYGSVFVTETGKTKFFARYKQVTN